jgi:predicted nucleic-acid-binding Zn-ribbon protein
VGDFPKGTNQMQPQQTLKMSIKHWKTGYRFSLVKYLYVLNVFDYSHHDDGIKCISCGCARMSTFEILTPGEEKQVKKLIDFLTPNQQQYVMSFLSGQTKKYQQKLEEKQNVRQLWLQ